MICIAYLPAWYQSDNQSQNWLNFFQSLKLFFSLILYRFLHPKVATMFLSVWDTYHKQSAQHQVQYLFPFPSTTMAEISNQLSSRTLGPCSTKTREGLGNPSPTPKRFPETRNISREQSPREISRAEGVDFPITPEFFYREWIRKSFPVSRERLTVVKSILLCWWRENALSFQI